MKPLEVIHLGRVSYAEGTRLMEARAALRGKDEVPDALFLLEHEPVLTLGRGASREHVITADDVLAARGIEVVHTGRGGDVTYHGPGQVVGYPVLDLKPDRRDVRRYVSDLEQVMIDVCAACGVGAGRVDGLIGAWIGGRRKVGAVGVRLSRWITSHGFALNVAAGLDGFSMIVPCGISDRAVTSLADETGRALSVADVFPIVEACFRARFSRSA